MRDAARAGGFVSVNHPRPFGPPWEYPEARGYHAIEVWNGPWELLNSFALAHREARLRAGERPVALGGSDTHRLRAPDPHAVYTPRLGQPTTWVQIDGPPTPDALLAGLRAGRCFVSASPAGPQLYLDRAGSCARVHAVGAPGATLMLVADAGCVAAAAIDPGGEDPSAASASAAVAGSLPAARTTPPRVLPQRIAGEGDAAAGSRGTVQGHDRGV